MSQSRINRGETKMLELSLDRRKLSLNVEKSKIIAFKNKEKW